MLNMFLLQLGTTLDMVGAAKHGIHFLERNLLSLGDKEPDENRQSDVDTGEHVESIEPLVLQEEREKLLDDGVGHVLGLRAHADGLGAHVHGEDLGCVDPHCSAP